jgi:tripartite-type tricarboxylate transporter receptor subunit TctC
MTRKWLMVVVALAAAVFADPALAQFYKGKTVTMIINYPAGGPTDIEGRIVAQHLPAHIAGKPTIVIKNVGGAGGVIGTINSLMPRPTAKPSSSSRSISSRTWWAIRRCASTMRIS